MSPAFGFRFVGPTDRSTENAYFIKIVISPLG